MPEYQGVFNRVTSNLTSTRYFIRLNAIDPITIITTWLAFRDPTLLVLRVSVTLVMAFAVSLVLSQVRLLGGRARPTLLTMESRVEEGSHTRLEFLATQDDVRLDDRLFTPSALERGE